MILNGMAHLWVTLPERLNISVDIIVNFEKHFFRIAQPTVVCRNNIAVRKERFQMNAFKCANRQVHASERLVLGNERTALIFYACIYDT